MDNKGTTGGGAGHRWYGACGHRLERLHDRLAPQFLIVSVSGSGSNRETTKTEQLKKREAGMAGNMIGVLSDRIVDGSPLFLLSVGLSVTIKDAGRAIMRGSMTPKVRAFIDCAAERFKHALMP